MLKTNTSTNYNVAHYWLSCIVRGYSLKNKKASDPWVTGVSRGEQGKIRIHETFLQQCMTLLASARISDPCPQHSIRWQLFEQEEQLQQHCRHVIWGDVLNELGSRQRCHLLLFSNRSVAFWGLLLLFCCQSRFVAFLLLFCDLAYFGWFSVTFSGFSAFFKLLRCQNFLQSFKPEGKKEAKAREKLKKFPNLVYQESIYKKMLPFSSNVAGSVAFRVVLGGNARLQEFRKIIFPEPCQACLC